MILDMDGVIVDSNPIHRDAWSIYNRRFGIETDEAMQQRMYGKRNDEIVRDFLGPHLTSEEVRAHGAAKERLMEIRLSRQCFIICGKGVLVSSRKEMRLRLVEDRYQIVAQAQLGRVVTQHIGATEIRLPCLGYRFGCKGPPGIMQHWWARCSAFPHLEYAYICKKF